MKRSVRSCLVDTTSKKAHVQNVICGSDLSFTIKRHNTLAEFPQFTLISSIDHLNSSIMKTIVSVSNLFCIYFNRSLCKKICQLSVGNFYCSFLYIKQVLNSSILFLIKLSPMMITYSLGPKLWCIAYF